MWDGVRCKRLERLETPHEGNIFSVVWLPGSEDGQLVSGAGDCRVCLADLEAGAVTRNVIGHQGRVKRLAVAGDAPGVVWSGGEDGLVRQWDTRERWTADSSNVLINLTNQVTIGNLTHVSHLTAHLARLVAAPRSSVWPSAPAGRSWWQWAPMTRMSGCTTGGASPAPP